MKPLTMSDWKPCWKKPVRGEYREQTPGEQHVSTREGITPLKPDDLIIRGVSGEEYPIGRDIFDATYDLAPPDSSEVDALRARLAETERLLDANRLAAGEAVSEYAELQVSAAASQARERALREALQLSVDFIFARIEGRIVDGLAAKSGRAAGRALATPTDDSALRGLMERAVAAGRLQGMHDQQFVTGGYGRSEPGEHDAAIVNRVLGPERPSAAEPAGKEG